MESSSAQTRTSFTTAHNVWSQIGPQSRRWHWCTVGPPGIALCNPNCVFGVRYWPGHV